MKINNFGPQGTNPYRQQQFKTAQTEQAAQKKADKVEISTTAKDLQQLSSLESERKAKIDELKTKIEEKTYNIDSKQIAEKILEFYNK